MPQKHTIPTRKTILYRLCDFLVEHRLSEAGDGINNPITIPLGQLYSIASPNERKEVKDKILMLNQEIKDNGTPLLEILNPTNPFKTNAPLLVRYKREDIEKYKKALLSGDEKAKKSKTARNSEEKDGIKKIIIVEPPAHLTDDDYNKVVINEDYENAKKIKGICWKKLIGAIKGEEIKATKQAMDYFNSNINCKIYFRGKYKLTKILEQTPNGNLKINSSVEPKIITTRSYNGFLNRRSAA